MSIHDLHVVYGEGRAREVVNRAIRAELIGGSVLLDAGAVLYAALRKSRAAVSPMDGCIPMGAAMDLINAGMVLMRDEIARRYDLGPPRAEHLRPL